MNDDKRNVVIDKTKVIVLISLLTGTLDLFAAIVVYKVSPVSLLKLIAGGAVGVEVARAGDFSMALLGFVLHYVIALFWTAFFFVVYPWISNVLKRYIVVTGLLYGALVWLVMNLIVLPYMSRIPRAPFDLSGALISMVILMVMIGLPVTILTHRYYRRKV